MKKFIYKITNQKDGKVYIGQARDCNSRFQQHKHFGYGNESYEKRLYQAFREDGITNFTFEIIEGPIENYNERERYWISFYHSYIRDPEYGDSKGYNATPGGEEPPIHIGEESPFLKHDPQDSQQVKYLLKNSDLTLKEIAEQTGYDVSAVKRINYGIIWHDETIIYPIRKPSLTKQEANERALEIIYKLKYTQETQKEIAKEFGVSRSTVTMINLGQNDKIPGITYPIRQIRKSTRVQGKPILMIDKDTDEVLKEFANATEAMNYIGAKQKESIGACARGEQKTSYGYKWKYKDKE